MTPFSLELVTLAMQFAAVVVQRMKFDLVVPRPAEFSGRIQPMIDTPAFFAYPSGHATQSYAVAAVLMRLVAPSSNPASEPRDEMEGFAQIARLAERISTNRVVAGLHFPVDNIAGLALGLSLGEYLAQRGGVGGLGRQRGLPKLPDDQGDMDFAPKLDLSTSLSPGIHDDAVEPADGSASPATAPALGWLWRRAKAEWRREDIYAQG
jgi:hypothetical protein